MDHIVFRPSSKDDFTGTLTNLNLIKPVKIIIEEEDVDAKKTKNVLSGNSSIENLQAS
tara:strand:- start:308 stop:481 length:174 start_codon:yes stop_codon:yes gene_type:complete